MNASKSYEQLCSDAKVMSAKNGNYAAVVETINYITGKSSMSIFSGINRIETKQRGNVFTGVNCQYHNGNPVS